jgi:hypothetical protein
LYAAKRAHIGQESRIRKLGKHAFLNFRRRRGSGNSKNAIALRSVVNAVVKSRVPA